ncbi:MAG: hypothetical protein ACJ746_31170 [Bryobacteraceae bacterium]
MQFDATLNLVWALLGALALARTLRSSRRVVRKSGRRRQLFEAVGVASIVIALFPYISATDDVLRVEQYTSHHKHQQSPGGHHNNLLRLFEAADHTVVSPSSQVALTFVFLELVVVLPFWHLSRVAPQSSGRSPPLFALA